MVRGRRSRRAHRGRCHWGLSGRRRRCASACRTGCHLHQGTASHVSRRTLHPSCTHCVCNTVACAAVQHCSTIHTMVCIHLCKASAGFGDHKGIECKLGRTDADDALADQSGVAGGSRRTAQVSIATAIFGWRRWRRRWRRCTHMEKRLVIGKHASLHVPATTDRCSRVMRSPRRTVTASKYAATHTAEVGEIAPGQLLPQLAHTGPPLLLMMGVAIESQIGSAAAAAVLVSDRM